ncbi:glycosyltransferase family 4 protein [Rhodocytophaga rosea]|uniref:Glycosyltransferase family 4 protein n=1 Tax=Rhodocytophaga rosea TaxID=2704465 RepID=A0A6C0GTD0_9BACT|nr:glycosyltransferase family 4 protein [Rhodocytophaga rosea]QHT70692.1 glycosyltransferase family 4 protein [Rhodocytophaga rosea]
MVPVKKILVLPDAGPENPFQYQMIDFLRKSGFKVEKEVSRRFFATTAAVKKHQPDVVYYDWIQSFILGKTLPITLLKCMCFMLECLYLIHIQRIPIVHTLHNIHNHAGLWLNIEKVVYTWFLRRCSRIRVYTQETKDKVISIFGLNPERIKLVYDVPFHHYYPNEVSRTESRQHLHIPQASFVYIFLGMVKPYKGIEDLIAAFRKIASLNDILMLIGASDRPVYADSIKSLVADDSRIIFQNEFVAVPQVQYYFNAADAVVLPFKNIEHSSSVDLAMSFAKPIITLKTKFMHSLLQHQSTLLFDEPADLANKLQEAKNLNLADIGQINFTIADSSNYKDFALLFTDLQSGK